MKERKDERKKTEQGRKKRKYDKAYQQLGTIQAPLIRHGRIRQFATTRATGGLFGRNAGYSKLHDEGITKKRMKERSENRERSTRS